MQKFNVFLLSLLSFCTTTIAFGGNEGIRVVYEASYESEKIGVEGKQFEALITDEKSIQYVLAYVAGQVAPQVLDEFCQGDCPKWARILRAQDCRGERCVTLRGIYAGRSPTF